MSNLQRWAVGLWLAGILACVLVMARTEYRADLSTFLPRSAAPAQRILVEQLRDGLVSRLILIALEGAPPDALASISNEVARRLRPEPDFVSVNNGESADLERDRDFVWRNRYLLSPTVTPEHFSPEQLRQALNDDLQMLGSAVAPLVKPMLPGDPTGEVLHLMGEFESGLRPASRDGVWFSPDGSRALLVIQTRASGFDADEQERALGLIDAAFRAAKGETAAARDARLVASGPGVFAVSTRQKIKEDAARFSMLATVMVAGLLLSVYRSLRVLALALLPVASGALAGLAAVSLGFGSVHGITLGFGVTLIGEAVDYAIYLFTQTAPGSPPEATLPRIWPTLRLGVLTSICGFSAMLLSSFSGLAQLGLFSIMGLVVAVSVTRWILPALLPRNFATKASAVFAPMALRSVRRARSLRYPLLLLVVAATILVFFQRNTLWDDELSSLSPVPQQDQLLDAQLRREIGAPDVRYLLAVTAPDPEQALAASEKLASRLQELAAPGMLAGFDFPARYLPSQGIQRARQAALPEPATLRANLTQALAGMPFRPDLFEPFLKDVAAAKTQPLIDRESLKGTHFALKLDALLAQRSDGWAALLPLRGVADPSRLAEAIAGLNQSDAILLDLKGDADRLYQAYRHEALMLALLGALVIILLLFLSLRSLHRVYEVAAPLAAAVMVVTALLVATGQKLSIFNLVGLLLVVAVGSNYALFFERQNIADGDGIRLDRERIVASLVLANLCTVIGFGVLSFSRIPVLHGIGMTVGIGAVLSLIFSAILSIHGDAGQASEKS